MTPSSTISNCFVREFRAVEDRMSFPHVMTVEAVRQEGNKLVR